MARRQVPIPEAQKHGHNCRSDLYKKAALIPGLFVKDGRRTLVDLDVYDREVIDKRPPAVITTGLNKKNQARKG
jgi:hypothetical protein